MQTMAQQQPPDNEDAPEEIGAEVQEQPRVIAGRYVIALEVQYMHAHILCLECTYCNKRLTTAHGVNGVHMQFICSHQHHVDE